MAVPHVPEPITRRCSSQLFLEFFFQLLFVHDGLLSGGLEGEPGLGSVHHALDVAAMRKDDGNGNDDADDEKWNVTSVEEKRPDGKADGRADRARRDTLANSRDDEKGREQTQRYEGVGHEYGAKARGNALASLEAEPWAKT